MGEIFLSEKKIDEAILSFRNSLEFASKFKDNKMGYSVYSNYLLGKIYYERGDMDQAKEFLKAVLKTSKRNNDLNTRSRELLKKI